MNLQKKNAMQSHHQNFANRCLVTVHFTSFVDRKTVEFLNCTLREFKNFAETELITSFVFSLISAKPSTYKCLLKS